MKSASFFRQVQSSDSKYAVRFQFAQGWSLSFGTYTQSKEEFAVINFNGQWYAQIMSKPTLIHHC
jgi:hypothetical protein